MSISRAKRLNFYTRQNKHHVTPDVMLRLHIYVMFKVTLNSLTPAVEGRACALLRVSSVVHILRSYCLCMYKEYKFRLLTVKQVASVSAALQVRSCLVSLSYCWNCSLLHDIERQQVSVADMFFVRHV